MAVVLTAPQGGGHLETPGHGRTWGSGLRGRRCQGKSGGGWGWLGIGELGGDLVVPKGGQAGSVLEMGVGQGPTERSGLAGVQCSPCPDRSPSKERPWLFLGPGTSGVDFPFSAVESEKGLEDDRRLERPAAHVSGRDPTPPRPPPPCPLGDPSPSSFCSRPVVQADRCTRPLAASP